MERAVLAGETLANDPRGRVDENGQIGPRSRPVGPAKR
jgi:hypothetical protein